MASEYLKWKFRDVQPEQKVELTPQQRRKNWWHYHKWQLLLGVVLLCIGVSILLNVLGVGKVQPDYQFAYVAAAPLPEDAAAALESALSTLGTDCNGDGRVAVQINQYVGGDVQSADGSYYALAASTKLMADLTARESYFFLLDDPESFQRNYHALRRLDGFLPTDADADWEACCLCWTDCPVLAGLKLGEYEEHLLHQELSGEIQELFSKLYIARRGFWSEQTCDFPEACEALWNELTKGANS